MDSRFSKHFLSWIRTIILFCLSAGTCISLHLSAGCLHLRLRYTGSGFELVYLAGYNLTFFIYLEQLRRPPRKWVHSLACVQVSLGFAAQYSALSGVSVPSCNASCVYVSYALRMLTANGGALKVHTYRTPSVNFVYLNLACVGRCGCVGESSEYGWYLHIQQICLKQTLLAQVTDGEVEWHLPKFSTT